MGSGECREERPCSGVLMTITTLCTAREASALIRTILAEMGGDVICEKDTPQHVIFYVTNLERWMLFDLDSPVIAVHTGKGSLMKQSRGNLPPLKS